jgi:tetratricopeptide (TPR) repeat protein
MPWLTRAMALNPTAGEPHLYAARCLAAAGQDAVAKREYRLAFVYGRGEALSEAGHRWDTVEDLLSVAPDSPDGLLAAAGVLAGQGRKDESREVLRRDLEQYADGRAVVPLTYLLIEARWFDEALVLARRRQVEAPLDAEGWRLGVELLSRLEREDEIEPELDRGLARLPASPPLVTYQVQRAMAAHRYSEAKRLAEGMAARTPAELAQRHAWIAGVLSAQGRLGEALEQARSAAAALPDAAWPLQSVSSYCEALGRWDDAIAALEHAAALPGQDQAYWAPRLEKVKKSKEDALQRRQTERLIEGK